MISLGEIEIYIPNEFVGRKILQVYGTSTCGLQVDYGYVISKHGNSVQVRLKSGVLAGYTIDNADLTDAVFLREQMDPDTEEVFWIVSKKKIDGQLNWINVRYDDCLVRFCPFTFRYKVINATDVS